MTVLCYQKNFNYQLHTMLSNERLDEARELVESKIDQINFSGKELNGFISLVLKYLLIIKDESKLDKWFNTNKSKLMKRDIKEYCKYYYTKDFEKANINFEYLTENYKLEDVDIDYVITNKMFNFLHFFENKYVKSSEKGYREPHEYLKLIPFDEDLIDTTISKISSQIIFNKQYNTFLNRIKTVKENKIIIDGGNILFSEKGTVNEISYKVLINTITHLINENLYPIVVLHNRHLKPKDKDEKIKEKIDELNFKFSEHICETPWNKNDDLYILHLSFILRCKILTKDNFKDHIFNFKSNFSDKDTNIIKNYIEDFTIKYDIVNYYPVIQINKLLMYSSCVQCRDNKVFIPTLDGKVISLNI